jgi:hypothetical protein
MMIWARSADRRVYPMPANSRRSALFFQVMAVSVNESTGHRAATITDASKPTDGSSPSPRQAS